MNDMNDTDRLAEQLWVAQESLARACQSEALDVVERSELLVIEKLVAGFRESAGLVRINIAEGVDFNGSVDG